MELLAAHVQPLARGGEDRTRGAACTIVDDQPDPGEQMFDVIQDQQQALVAHEAQQHGRGVAALYGQVERASDREGQPLHGGQRRQLDEEDTVGVGGEAGAGQLQGQPGLAHPARAHQGQQPHLLLAQQSGERGQVGLAPDQRRERRRQVMTGRRGITGRRCQGAAADALVQPARLHVGFDTQFLVQRLPAPLVLPEGRVALSQQRQPVHQLAVGRLVPGFQLQLAAGAVAHRRIVGGLLVRRGQSRQGVQHRAMQLLPLHQRPLLEGIGIR